MDKNEQIASNVLELVGGKGNVTFVSRCMTRLRFRLKDESIPDMKKIKEIDGVMGAQFLGGQLQIIIGQHVELVYDAVCKMGDFSKQEVVSENLDAKPQKLTVKGVLNAILDGLTGCLTPLIPVLVCAGLLKMIVTVISPSMLNLVTEESNLYQILTIAGDAGFYFLPVMLAWSGSKKFGCNTVIAIMMAGILLHPSLSAIVTAGNPFTVFGIPMKLVSYASSVVPVILITYAISVIEKLLKKIIPDALELMLVPILTILIMLPLGLCILGPLGSIIGSGFCSFLVWLCKFAGPVGTGLIGFLWLFLVATGMHLAVITLTLVTFSTQGFDAMLFPAVTPGIYALIAVDLAYALKARNSEQRSLGISCLISQVFGGIGEPAIFGILLRNKKALLAQMIGGCVGGIYIGLMHVIIYVLPIPSTIFCLVGYAGGTTANLVNGVIACVLAAVVSFVLMMFVRVDEKVPDKKPLKLK